MTIREQVTKAIDRLSEGELHQVADYLTFLKFRSRFHRRPLFDEKKIAELYAEFCDEDSKLAEEGMDDYNDNLLAEDTK
ncbi:MAG: hypothetical protein ACE5EH_13030 [Gammaproteobacteria bacterium]